MQRRALYGIVGVIVAGLCLGAAFAVRHGRQQAAARLLATGASAQGAAFDAPLNNTHFPPDLAPPSFAWHAKETMPGAWLIGCFFGDGSRPLVFRSSIPAWRPSPAAWRAIRRRCGGGRATLTVVGTTAGSPARILCAASVAFRFSPDPVEAPIFYREVNLPSEEAIKDPSRIRWRMGRVSSRTQPPVVLENLPVCGNCHSFSRDGSIMGMDVDYANDKGSYFVSEVCPTFDLSPGKIYSWNDYQLSDGVPSYGLLSQVSPDGRYVVSTIKDRSVFMPKPGLEFSQLFFPIQGILAVYDRQTKRIAALPGADDPTYVQSNPCWSPDGRTIVFARSVAYRPKSLRRREEYKKFLTGGATFQYDLYSIPFNGGRGGQAIPLAGASKNGKSNYFPKFSPDGRWIVFCQAASFMLLQPDSKLFIVPASGGEARLLDANLSRMNSWHSWSPNARWLVFSSKTDSLYTQLYLTHIDEQGNSTPAVLLDTFTQQHFAANIPEFIGPHGESLRCIRERFIDDPSRVRPNRTFNQ